MAQILRRSVSIFSTLRNLAPNLNRPVQRLHSYSPLSQSRHIFCARNVSAPYSSASSDTSVCALRHVSGLRFANKTTIVYNRTEDSNQREWGRQQVRFSSASRGQSGSSMDAINELNEVRGSCVIMQEVVCGHRFTIQCSSPFSDLGECDRDYHIGLTEKSGYRHAV